MRKIIRRRLKIAGQPRSETHSERQSRTAVKYIEKHPMFKYIVGALQEGTPIAELARYAIEQGWFDINQKTAIAYFQYFKKARPELCTLSPDDATRDGYSHLFNGNEVPLDVETELIRLIKLQRVRIGIDFGNERNISKLFNTTHKEMTVLRELLETLAKVRGMMGKDAPGYGNAHYDESVKADLQSIKQQERQRDMLTTLVRELAYAD